MQSFEDRILDGCPGANRWVAERPEQSREKVVTLLPIGEVRIDRQGPAGLEAAGWDVQI